MEEEKNAFYLVKKGDLIGIYRSLKELHTETGSSVVDPSLHVYKGSSLSEKASSYLASHGLKNAVYSLNARDVNDDIFGSLQLCSFQQPVSTSVELGKVHSSVAIQEMLDLGETEEMDMLNCSSYGHHKRQKKDICLESRETILTSDSCILKFDGASKGNPGQAGAGAVLQAEDGSLICRLREGVGIATNNVAEYRALLLGLKYALRNGIKNIQIFGDSNLVCMQVQGLWKTKNPNMAELCKEAKELMGKFLSFRISHVVRELNSEADAQANLGVGLRVGQVIEERAGNVTFFS